MLIGSKYANNKLYRGIKHYDALPLTSEDIHEYADTLNVKNAYTLNNILGSGILNSPTCTISATGIGLSEPAVLLIDGDVVLIQSSTSNLISASTIEAANYSNGVACIVGWYQALNSNSTLREYGGVNNLVLQNDLINTNLDIQVSTRYQLRWDIVLIDKSTLDSNNISFSLLNRDSAGSLTTGSSSITISGNLGTLGTVKVAEKPSSMLYAVSNLYIIPLVNYTYQNSIITDASTYKPIKPKGSTSLLKQSTEPVGDDFSDGTLWFDTDTNQFSIYVEGEGFVPTSSAITLINYNTTVIVDADNLNPTNVVVNIGVPDLVSGDILQVNYEGITLVQNIHYTINYTNRTITLLDFITHVGDIINFTVTKLADTTSATTIVSEFNSHIVAYGNSESRGHVSLTDTPGNSGANLSIAATPRLVNTAIGRIGKTIKFTNLSVPISSYTADATHTDYPFRARITTPNVTADMIPSITYSVADVLLGIHCPVATAIDGYIYIYASEIPATTVAIMSILCQGGDIVE